MKISERDWLDVRAQLRVLEVLVAGLVRESPRADVLIDSFREVGQRAHDLMISTPMTDAEIAAEKRAHKRLLARLRPGKSPRA